MVIHGDALEVLKTLDPESVPGCVTSPPYWGLRDYGVEGQLGMEKTPGEFVEKMVLIFREVRRVLKTNGTLWLNLGDSYAAQGKDRTSEQAVRKSNLNGGISTQMAGVKQISKIAAGLKPKDLCGIPWRVAFGLQDDGWYLRQDIIWHKPNPMPESVTDRFTKAHEYIFLLSKSKKYLFNVDNVKEFSSEFRRGRKRTRTKKNGISTEQAMKQRLSNQCAINEYRRKRSVWSVTTKSFKGAHFAVYPPDLIAPCILAGSAKGDTVLDPFFGAGTTGLVANKFQREFVGIELNIKYIELAQKRLADNQQELIA